MSPNRAPVSPSRELQSKTSKIVSPPSAQTIFNEIVDRIPTIRSFTELVFDVIPPEDGNLICRSLAASAVVEQSNARVNYNSRTKTLWVRIMPTELHDVHQRWVRYTTSQWQATGILNAAEDRLLDMGVGTRFDTFTGPYVLSSKEPDLFLRPDTSDLPLIVIESGWSESWPRLHCDKDLWLNGSSEVNVVILLMWSKISNNRAKGMAEVWRRGGDGLTVCKKAGIPLLCAAPAPGADVIELSRREIFGQHVLPGRSHADLFLLDLEDRRNFAQERMAKKMGLTPA
ncbi:hypothetical protein ANOM_001974 [Aspergillus nomiae NRRL 13137]|uniref:Uncharacterized protein n=1 Tax=Aspergillus nomiae NRRL (strain ATCC 15546 / NRRL 13137 / CBS 260.88 / M93) TaxID=1509407 RepID=A0A0L1JEA5_ASPN3|nr:uncharacterized protein ANOM_001974 [Aspergillus nomiae NRRL 13137]KNG89743.1 hypothetical protein ANOM_001974 [Aspergillus nomiae NRRL 13137]